LKRIIFNIYRKLFAKKAFANINRYLYTLSLKGLGINNYENDYYSGENFLLNNLKLDTPDSIIFDVGANVGNYANHLTNLYPKSTIYSFEPHPKIFTTLQNNCNNSENIKIFNFGFGDSEKELVLYDYKDEEQGSEHASLYKEVFDNIYKVDTEQYNIQIKTIDDFVKEKNIHNITLLKTDTEGNDYSVLLGAEESLRNNLIDIIHFEFNSMNTASRVYFKDFFYLLNKFDLYRLLPTSALKITDYEPVYNEIFGFQNIVAVRKDSQFKKLFR
jgi:FkbM family methyltransferase